MSQTSWLGHRLHYDKLPPGPPRVMQSFGIIPAAGRSVRMGQAKLLLPWGEATVIEHVLGIWRSSRVSRSVMVVHPDDHELAQIGRRMGAHVVQPETPPPQMRDSVLAALELISASFQPRPDDCWILAPADMIDLNAATIDGLLEAYARRSTGDPNTFEIWAPESGGRRGHPVLFTWSLAGEVAALAPNEGINALLARKPVQTVSGLAAAVNDLDTPDDFERLRGKTSRGTEGRAERDPP